MSVRKIIFLFPMMFFLTSPLIISDDNINDILNSGIAEKRNTEAGLFEMIKELELKLKQNPNDYDALWMSAALNYFYGDFYASDKDTKKKYFTICKDYADKAVRIKPKGIAGHYWLGVGMAKWAEYNGVIYSLFTADDIMNEMTTVINLNPQFFMGTPWAIRATVYAMAPPLISVGDKDKAKEDIQKALFYSKNYRATYQIVADVYVYWRDWEQADKIIDQALSIPYNPLMEVEENDCIRKLRALKQKVVKELARK
jgi:tetratricopeptide (TPR) repeat protein